MLRKNQLGAINILLLPLIVAVMLLIGAGTFAFWAYGGRQDYKNNSDQKVAVAVSAAIKAEDVKDNAAFAEVSKSPLKTYIGPSTYGSLHVSYPKIWSAYINETGNGNTAVDGYFYPDFVPDLNSLRTSYALRIQIVNQSYSQALQTYSQYVDTGGVTITPYSLPLVKSVVGSRIKGSISNGTKVGDLILLPLRDTTLQIWTEGTQFENDFNNYILPNVSFSP